VSRTADFCDNQLVSSASTRSKGRQGDTIAANATQPAREAAVQVGSAAAVGQHLGYEAEGERVVTHYFTCELPGYAGWRWAVTVVRAARARTVTISECVLLPGAGALLAPAWVPWEERITPNDLGPGDLLPVADDDPRLTPGYLSGDDEDAQGVFDELGVGREWVLSQEGRSEAAQRWYEGGTGPHTEIAMTAPGRCGTCGFAVLLVGSLGQAFSVCTNERTPFDGKVVAHTHGCGGHSDVRLPPPADDTAEPVVDTLGYELVPLEF
jgi:hypothetical protein